MENFQLINDKFMTGDSLSDEDLKALSDFYLDLCLALEELGCEFALALHECHHRLKQLQGFQRARGHYV